MKKLTLTRKDIAFIGMMVAVIEVCKMALGFLPNIELTTFWLIIFTLYFGWKMIFVVPVFLLIEISVYGFQLWVIMYLYIWPLLVLLVWIFRRQTSLWFWSILSSLYGLFFGLLCSIPYVVIGAAGNGILSGLHAGFTWWVAGIPWDLVHAIGNFVLMFVLFKPVRVVIARIQNLGNP
ncbi:MAG: hypothetical protein NC124_19145 [Clostridium sp.]|nr:hypothetical protein [Clostridium sp.]MCM1569482.1 hypothetical protein [Roseburia sp.]